MKTVLDKAASRGHADHGWLKTSHTFSFADYYNPQRMNFGVLRVLNDDQVAPDNGFGMHEHRNMEVISIPLSGYLRHGDSIENSEVISRGDIQVMSAGTGIYHSEFNDSPADPLAFLQIWVIPKMMNTAPHYKSYDVRKVLHKNKLSLIISPDGDAPASILQDAWFSIGELDSNFTVEYKMHRKESGVYLFVIEGEVSVGDIVLSRRDGLGIYDTSSFELKALKNTEVLLMEFPMK